MVWYLCLLYFGLVLCLFAACVGCFGLLVVMDLIVLVFFVGLVFVYYGGSLVGTVASCFGILLRCVFLSSGFVVLYLAMWLFGLCGLLDWLLAVCFGFVSGLWVLVCLLVLCVVVYVCFGLVAVAYVLP